VAEAGCGAEVDEYMCDAIARVIVYGVDIRTAERVVVSSLRVSIDVLSTR
jgi:hypothetical protein